ncbi:hypothetical protein CR513_11210, partial [Mucuna pruriens]
MLEEEEFSTTSTVNKDPAPITWELVDPPPNKKPIALKWVYKVKFNPKGEVVKHKAKLVAKVTRIEIVRLVVAIAINAD